VIKLLLLISVLTFTLGSENSLQQTTFTAVTVGNNEIRALTIVNNIATDNSIAVGGLKGSLSTQGSDTITAQLNAGGFKFAGGITGSKEPQLGFAALSATGTWSNLGSGNLYVNVQGAWAEIVFGLSTIFLYKERNGQPGFQYKPGYPVFSIAGDCSEANSEYDCIYSNSDVKLNADLTWANLVPTPMSCSTAGLAGYSPNCTIWQITARGSLAAAPVLQVDLTLASQKVIMGPTIVGAKSHQLGPDFGKVDFKINYPWTAKGQDANKANANVAMACYAAGKAGASKVTQATLDGKSALLWETDTGKAAVWSWDGEAYVTSSTGTNVESSVYINGLSGDAILAWQAPANCILDPQCVANSVILTVWQIVINVVKGLGWTPEILLLSWDVKGPTEVYYDPGYGMTDNPNSGMFLAAPTFIYIVWVLVHYFYRH